MRRLLCRTNTEKTAAVLQRAGIEVGEKNPQPAGQRTLETAAPGHGRHEAAAYRGARKVKVAHGSLHQGDRCPGVSAGQSLPAARSRPASTGEGRRIEMFFTGRKHAGENLSEVLKRRAAERGPPPDVSSGAYGPRNLMKIAPSLR